MDIQNRIGGAIFAVFNFFGVAVQDHPSVLDTVEQLIRIASFTVGFGAGLFLLLYNIWKYKNRHKIAQAESQSPRDYPTDNNTLSAIWNPEKAGSKKRRGKSPRK